MNIELRARIKTAVVLIGSLLTIGVASLFGCFFHWILFDVALVVVAISSYEYSRFSQPESSRLSQLLWTMFFILPSLSVVAGVTLLGLCEPVEIHAALVELLIVAFALAVPLLGFSCLRNRYLTIGGILVSLGERMLALVFLGFCAAFLLIIAALPEAFYGIAWLVSVVAVNDSSAYFAGKRFGKHPFAPVVSPHKTIEGSGVGLVACALAGGALGIFLLPQYTFLGGVGLSLIVGVGSQVGDLMKSLLKRLHNTKDSGTILPGHGGMLDRIDGLIGGAPLFYLLKDWFVG